MSERVLIGSVPVDSACLVICDPAYLPDFAPRSEGIDDVDALCVNAGATDLNDMHHHKAPKSLPFSDAGAWVASSSRDRGGQLGFVAVAARTGFGDGTYPVYVEKDEHGLVERIVIECIAD